jgi:hypothetical protein
VRETSVSLTTAADATEPDSFVVRDEEVWNSPEDLKRAGQD